MSKIKQPLKKSLMLSMLMLLMPLSLLAQNIKVQGVVKDQSGETVIGATVTQKGTSNATVTDIDGNFTLSVPTNSTLTISYIGYASQEVAVNGKTTFDIVLKDDSQLLNEVVVVGYGTMDKKELTSAISHVGEKDFLTVSSLDPSMMIQGKVAGVSITNTGSGDPNNQASIQIRGVSSRSAGLGPLIVIDGVPGGNLTNINPNDIASFDVLKDGAASAIYGTRGSNGVIVVTTKKGSKDGQTHASYSGQMSWDVINNDAERQTAVSLQIMAGGPVAVADQPSTIGSNLTFYTNSELIQLRKDGFVGQPLNAKLGESGNEVWYGTMQNGDYVVGLFNRSDQAQTLSVNLSQLGIDGEKNVRDLWTHTDEGNAATVSASVPAHGCKIVRLTNS